MSILAKSPSAPGGAFSRLWFQGLLLTLVLGFTGLLMGGVAMYRSAAPIPKRILDPAGQVLATEAQIKGGQAVYQKYGLMDYGSVLGHGAYLGQDFTAESLHLFVRHMRDHLAQARYGRPYADLGVGAQAEVADAVIRDLKTHRYDKATGDLRFTAGQAYALGQVEAHYRRLFTQGDTVRALPVGLIREQHLPQQGRAWVSSGDQISQITRFFAWTAWLASVNRPGLSITYTNNWPHDRDAGNTVGFSSVLWSAWSVALLILALAFILYLHHRYKLSADNAYKTFPRFNLALIPVTASQRKTAKYFLVVSLLFLTQAMLGGYLAHAYIEGNRFYGIDTSRFLPFNVARSWHLQLAVFWIATAWLAMGIYVAPLVSGREPKGQKHLVDILFGALVLVVVGSLAGQWLGVKGLLGNRWFLLGHQGWEYLELGRLWQILLAVGLGLWVFIIARALRSRLQSERDKGSLSHLLLYSSAAIPFLYGFAFLMNPSSHLTMADYWRWWIIHMWVEGMFEVFAVVVISFLMVHMGLVTYRTALRALYFQLIILLGSGIVGTGHHYYWIGAPEMWIGLGSVFSALEVVPLTLLAVEAYGQYRVCKEGGHEFPYRASFWFLIAVAVWNLVGAGFLGFLINLPMVSYFQHGSYLTAAHGHGALMGVYGMLGIGLLLFTLRNITLEKGWSDKPLWISFWGLNIGLAGMIITTLVPVGSAQLAESFNNGFWSARSMEFYLQPAIRLSLWLRIIPDSLFIVVGILPLVYQVARCMWNLRPATVTSEQFEVVDWSATPEKAGAAEDAETSSPERALGAR